MNFLGTMTFLIGVIAATPLVSDLGNDLKQRDSPPGLENLQALNVFPMAGSLPSNNSINDKIAGALVQPSAQSDAISQVHAWFNVPKVSYPHPDTGVDPQLQIWTSINDVDTENGPKVYIACFSYLNKTSESPTFGCSWGWYPWSNGVNGYFSDFTASPQDTIAVAVVLDSPTQGTLTVTNTNTRQTVSHIANAPASDAIRARTASWTLAVFGTDSTKPETYMDYDPIKLTGCSANTASETLGLYDARVWTMQLGAELYAVTKVLSDRDMTISRSYGL